MMLRERLRFLLPAPGSARDRFAPRARVVAQKLQCSSQPSWILSHPRWFAPKRRSTGSTRGATKPAAESTAAGVGARDHRAHRWQGAEGPVVARGGAAHHDGLERPPVGAAGEPAHEAPQLDLALLR